MNNSLLAVDPEENLIDITPVLRQKQTELLKVIEALQGISQTKEWQELKELLFDKLVENLENRLKIESSNNELNAPEIYRLNGQLFWAKRYSDFNKLVEAYKTELNNITKKLNENASN